MVQTLEMYIKKILSHALRKSLLIPKSILKSLQKKVLYSFLKIFSINVYSTAYYCSLDKGL